MVLAMGHRSLEQVRLPDVGLAELMRLDPDRAERLVLSVGDLRVDLSRQPVTDETSTRSPTPTVLTSRPTSVTVPTAS